MDRDKDVEKMIRKSSTQSETTYYDEVVRAININSLRVNEGTILVGEITDKTQIEEFLRALHKGSPFSLPSGYEQGDSMNEET